MNFLSELERLKKSQLWFLAVMISILLTEMIVSAMEVLLMGKVTADYLLTGLVASGFVATLVVGMMVFFMDHLSLMRQDNDYLNSIILKLNQLTQTLRDNDDAYRSILATTLDGFWIISSEGKLLDVNHRYIEQSGYSREELLKMYIIDLEAKESTEQNASHIRHVIEAGGDQFESIHRRKNGTFWHVEISVTYRSVNGGVFYAFFRDITDRKRLEKSLSESEALLRNIMDAAQAVIYMKDLAGRYVHVNKRCKDIFQLSGEMILGKTDHDIFAPEVADIFRQNDLIVIQSGQELKSEELAIHADGSEHTYLSVKEPLRNTVGEIYAVCGISTDITERKQTETALQENEAMLRAITDNTNTIIFIKDLTDHFIFVNKMFEDLYQVKNKTVRGKTTCDVFPQDLANKFIHDDRLVAKSGEPITIEEAVPQSDSIHSYITVKFPLKNCAGEIYAICGISTDITKRKRLEQEVKLLSESELNKAKLEAERASRVKSDFLSSMSHELFTPMNAVLGFAQILACEDLTAEQQAHVDSILTGGYQLLDLIKEVLDFSLVESENLDLKLKKLDLAVLVQGCITLMQSLAVKKGINIINNITQICHVTVVADSLRLKQVLLNLISNAIKYNHENGSITLSCELIQPDRIRISITDTGPGLSEEQLANLFQPFERLTAKNSAIEGAGLGLCISKKLIEAMNGRLGVQCIVGEGCRFWIEIPLAA